jgi:predicted house-cleaning noncanonical NTP pyrophosphatase (MazG superfamily)
MRESLIFTIHNDKELKEKVLNLFGVQVECPKQRCAIDKEYNVNLLYALYEKVVTFYQIQTSERLCHLLFLINSDLKEYK